MKDVIRSIAKMVYFLVFAPFAIWEQEKDSPRRVRVTQSIVGLFVPFWVGLSIASLTNLSLVTLSPLSRLLWGTGIVVGLAVLFFNHNKEKWLAVCNFFREGREFLLVAWVVCVVLLDAWFSLGTYEQLHVPLWFALVANGVLLVTMSAVLYWVVRSLWRIGCPVIRLIGEHVIGGQEWLTVDEKRCVQKHDSLPEFVHQCLWHRWGLFRGRSRILHYSLSLPNFWKFGGSTKEGTWVWVETEALALLVRSNGPMAVTELILKLSQEKETLVNCFQAVYDLLPGRDRGRSDLIMIVRRNLDLIERNWRAWAISDDYTYERIKTELEKNNPTQQTPTAWKPL